MTHGTQHEIAARAHALGDKAAQVGKTLVEGVGGAGQAIATTVAGTTQIAVKAGSDAAEGVRNLAGQASISARSTSAQMQETNPLGFAIGMGVLGLLLGLAFPSTRVEKEKLAPLGDKAAQRFGPRDLLAHAKAMVFAGR